MNEQRDAVAQRLSEQFAADRLSLEELERRLDLVYQAQSPAELSALTADLPAPVAMASPVVRGSHGAMTRSIRTVLGNVERSGAMELPPLLEVRAVLGNIELDLREASFGPFTEIAIRSVLGNVEITLPAGVRIENDGDGFLGSFECHVAPGAMPMVGTAPVVRLTGRVVLGNVEVHAMPGLEPPGVHRALGRGGKDGRMKTGE
ncbi:MAG: DUF1707 and DUF2154 domain-containing protein [Gemmatimonadaceae bacterium]|nr:DUF1707 and DUF2154 domain-containing protein [Gemmatimonadaceae bacterium]